MRTIVDQISIEPNGTARIRLLKQVLSGQVVISQEPHLVVLSPGTDVDAYIEMVGAALGRNGHAALSQEEIGKIKAVVDAVWTVEVIAAYIASLPQAVPPSIEDLIAANVSAVQAALDAAANGKGYDNIVSACSYAAQSAGYAFQAEGAAFLKWRSDVWTHAYSVLAEVEAGNMQMPTPAEAAAMMPALELPD